jgi:HlyD family secretion protein
MEGLDFCRLRSDRNDRGCSCFLTHGWHPRLRVHTVGGVIGNGETIMQTVSRADELVVEAKVAPFRHRSGRNGSHGGSAHHVRQPAHHARHYWPGYARVSRRRTGASKFHAASTGILHGPHCAPERVTRLKDIHLVPGMPAEVFIQTHERSPLQYLLKPLQEQIARTFRER